MSYLVEEDVVCSFCKHPNLAEVWSAINVREDSELKDLLLGGELNMVECEACREFFYAEHFLLYHDPDRELMAFVYPASKAEEGAVWEEKMRADFAQMQASAAPEEKIPYEPLTLFGLDALVAVVEKDEEEAIQGEIVSLLADQHHFPLKRLRLSTARGRHIPAILPYTERAGRSARENLIDSLASLERINDRLFIYTELKRRLMEQPDAALEVGG